jgi:hypothetical protein
MTTARVLLEQSLPRTAYRVLIDGEPILEATGTLCLDLYDLERLLVHLGMDVEMVTEPLPVPRTG